MKHTPDKFQESEKQASTRSQLQISNRRRNNPGIRCEPRSTGKLPAISGTVPTGAHRYDTAGQAKRYKHIPQQTYPPCPQFRTGKNVRGMERLRPVIVLLTHIVYFSLLIFSIFSYPFSPSIRTLSEFG